MMVPSLYFSRATLRADPSIAALGKLLLPDEEDRRLDADHRLVWSLFAGDPEARRDFLYRRDPAPAARPKYFILSQRPPALDSALFDVETKPFDPQLSAGDLLRFSLLANPTVSRSRPKEGDHKPRGLRHDVVMDALQKHPAGSRADARRGIIEREGRAWLERQAVASGFALEDADDSLKIDGYVQRATGSHGRGRSRGRQICVSLLSFDGLLRVTEPAVFRDRLSQGFGRARAFGCGLMLIRRA